MDSIIFRSWDPWAFAMDPLVMPWDQFTLIYSFSPPTPRLFPIICSAGSRWRAIWCFSLHQLGLGEHEWIYLLLAHALRERGGHAWISALALTLIAWDRDLSDSLILTLLKARKLTSWKAFHRTWKIYFVWCRKKKVHLCGTHLVVLKGRFHL